MRGWATNRKPREGREGRPKPPPEPFEAAVRLLAVRPHSNQELRQKLYRRGCEAEAIEAALARCRELGYLDDGSYAAALVRRRSSTRGSAAIAAELARKGIGRDLAQELLSGRDEAEVEAALRILTASRPDATRRLQISAKLQRRGFSPSVIRQAWRRLGSLDEDLTEA